MPEEITFSGQLMNLLLSLGGIIAAVLILSWALRRVLRRRLQLANESNHIKIVERRSLSPKSSLYLIEVSGQSFLIADTPTGVHLIGSVPSLPQQPCEEESRPSFQDVLNKLKPKLFRS